MRHAGVTTSSALLLRIALAAARFPRRIDLAAPVGAGELERLATCFPAFLAAQLGELAAPSPPLGETWPTGFTGALRGYADARFSGAGEPPEALAKRLGIDPAAGVLAALALPKLGGLRRADIAGLQLLDAAMPGPVPLSRFFRMLLFAIRLRRPDMVAGAVDGSVGSVLDWTLLFGLSEYRLWHLLPPADRNLMLAGTAQHPPLFLRAALRFRPDLRALREPLALREWLRRSASAEYAIDLAQPATAEATPGRLTLIGPWRQVLGIADDCFSAARALDALGADYEVLAARPTRFIELDQDKVRALQHRAAVQPSGERALFCDTLFEATFWALANWPRFRAFRQVDLFAPWELPALPAGWSAATALFDTIMTPSLFTRAVFTGAGATRVRRLCSSIELSGRPAAAGALALRGRLTLPARARVFACVFDFSSVMRRKNPEAAIAAFGRLRRRVPNAILVIKTTRGRRNIAATRRLRALLRTAPGIRWVDGAWPNLAIEGLLRRADALVSLHRAEGFGRNIAKTLCLGGRAVVTDWSGNTDLRAEPGYVGVPFTLRPLADADYFSGGGQSWAEPDGAAAARAMRRALAATPRTPGRHTALRFSRGRFAHGLRRALTLPPP